MSYCHINGGVNLALGFGPLPGNYIRQRYNNAPCLIGIKQISSQVPQQFELSQNYPNPFNPQTIIKFSVAVKSKVKLIIYDAIGREVDLLVDEWLEPGFYEAEYNTNKLSSGVYYYKFFTKDFSKTKKMVLIK
jgi:hypothetical protein